MESYLAQGYSDEVKQLCLKMYVNGMGFRAIERVTGINHNSMSKWVKQTVIALPDAPEILAIPEIAQVDELQTFVGNKKNKVLVWSVANHLYPGILASGSRQPQCNHFQITLADTALLEMMHSISQTDIQSTRASSTKLTI